LANFLSIACWNCKCVFWCKKLRIFRNLWCVRTDKGVEPVRTREVNFSRFCADVFYRRPQWP